jgi:predicted PurR-regulated permease PerM
METGTSRNGVPAGLVRASEWTWRLLIIAAGVLALCWALAQVFVIVVVVVVALLLTTFFDPPAQRLRARGWSPGAATALSMTVGLLIVVGVVALLVPAVADEFSKVGDQAAAGVREAQRWLINGPLHLSGKQVDNIANGIVRELQGGSGSSLVSGVVSGALTAGAIVAAVLLTIALTALFVRDGREVFGWLVGLLPATARPRAQQIGNISWDTLSSYIRGIALIGLVDAAFIGLGLLIVGVPLVVPLMVVTFIGAFIPLAGSTIAGVLAALVALVSQGGVAALIVIAIVIAVQQTEGNVLYPVIMRRATDAHPIAVLLGVSAGAILAGIFGAIVAVPVVAVIGRVIAVMREEHSDDLPPRFVVSQPGEVATAVRSSSTSE